MLGPMRSLLLIIVVVGLIGSARIAQADVIWNLDSDGRLVSADGVELNGLVYSVAFRDGTCVDNFSGCDVLADLPFNDEASAQAASLALLNQVFVDTPQGLFDSLPALTAGCGAMLHCYVLTPHFLIPVGNIGNHFVSNEAAKNGVFRQPAPGITINVQDEITGGFPLLQLRDLSTGRVENGQTVDDDWVWAVWQQTGPVTPVPEPHTLSLLALGLATVVWRRR
jgi:hypothetical protein